MGHDADRKVTFVHGEPSAEAAARHCGKNKVRVMRVPYVNDSVDLGARCDKNGLICKGDRRLIIKRIAPVCSSRPRRQR